MPIDRMNQAEYLIKKVMRSEGADLVFNHPWVWEVDRWKELIFSLLTKVINLPEHEIRDLVDSFEVLALLDVKALAELQESQNADELGGSHAQRMLQLFEEKGLSKADAQRAFTTICEAALGLEKHYKGKVQCYLRHYGEIMLGDLDQVFRFTALEEAEVKEGFTCWLQNVMNMPLSLVDKFVDAFCKENNLKPDEVFAAADELSINFALIDDLLQRHVEIKTRKIAGEDNSGNETSDQKLK